MMKLAHLLVFSTLILSGFAITLLLHLGPVWGAVGTLLLILFASWPLMRILGIPPIMTKAPCCGKAFHVQILGFTDSTMEGQCCDCEARLCFPRRKDLEWFCWEPLEVWNESGKRLKRVAWPYFFVRWRD